MTGHVHTCIRSALFSVLAGGLLSLTSANALAAVAEGCDPRVLNAMQATAQARVAASKAIDDEIYDQDDSVLALTCFNQSAAISAQQAGAIFSGDFSAQLAPVINDALAGMYANFNAYTIGARSGAVVYSGPGPGGYVVDQMPTGIPNINYNCGNTAALWSEVNGAGVKTGVPYVTFDDLMNGATATAAGGNLNGQTGTNFMTSWNSPNSVAAFNAMQTALDPANYPQPAIPSFAADTNPCQVLRTAGALPAATACPP